MKKVIIVLALAVLMILPVAAKKQQQIGLEVGMVDGVNYRKNLDKNMNLTASVGTYGFSSVYGAVGALYESKTVSIDKAKFYHQYGAQVELGVDLAYGAFYVAPMVMAEVDYDFKWLDTTFTTFLRLSYGPSISFAGSGVAFDFGHFGASLGLIHVLDK